MRVYVRNLHGMRSPSLLSTRPNECDCDVEVEASKQPSTDVKLAKRLATAVRICAMCALVFN